MNGTHRKIPQIQEALKRAQTPAWLFFGFHDNDPIGVRILEFGPGYHATRRWFYLVPAEGEPVKLVHRIESAMLDHLPGRKLTYLRWEEMQAQLKRLLDGVEQVAMQYSEMGAIPYISRVDAGIADLIRSLGKDILSSGNLIQEFEAVWTPGQLENHRRAAGHLARIARAAFRQAAEEINSRESSDEYSIQQYILENFQASGLVTDSAPIVAVNRNSADPHYQPSAERHAEIKKGDLLLIDLWAKMNEPDAVYADITWMGYLGRRVPDNYRSAFELVRQARDRGVRFIREELQSGTFPAGFRVDDAVRGVIEKAGFGEYFVHRTGHNLGQEVHGNGVNFDNLETHDTRLAGPGVGCTIEPGIYLDDFGIRSEIDIYISDSDVEVTTESQDSILTVEPG
jgi:Xaa-Pro dipeptidase